MVKMLREIKQDKKNHLKPSYHLMEHSTKDHHKNGKILGDIKTILSIEAIINTEMIISLLSLHLCLFLPLHHGIAF